MDVRQVPCNRRTIERFFADGLSAPEQTVLEAHLGDCPACRQCLEELAADGSLWHDARSYLSDVDLSAGGRATAAIGEPEPDALAGLRAHLAPTDDPRFAGRFGGYGVVGVVGCGGFGVVLKAFDGALNRYVAIKVLIPHLAASGAARQRFAREAKAAAAVMHDNVIAIYAVAEVDGLPYFVMPYVSGPSLEKRLRESGPLAVVEVVRIGRQIAMGLAAAHAQGLVHRDIKPANILLAEGVERVTITDFGLARAVDDASLTRSGVIAGTPPYMSPEQAAGYTVDHRSDLFSLGSVMYAMCTGRPPFRAETTLAVLRRVEESRPRPILEVKPEIPAWLVRLIAALHAKDPAHRFQSAAEVAELLQSYLLHLGQPSAAPPPPLPSFVPALRRGNRGRRRIGWLAVALACGIIGLSVALLGQVQPSASEPPKEFYEDFRGGRSEHPGLVWSGLDGTEEILPESGGLRIKLPPTRSHKYPAGLVLPGPVTGDFEITAGYEIMGTQVPQSGSGTGVEVYIMTDSPSQDGIALARVRRGNKSVAWGDLGQLFLPFHTVLIPGTYSTLLPPSEKFIGTQMTTVDGHRRYSWRTAPAAGSVGRLRMGRQGGQVLLQVADASSDQFRIVASFDFGSDDLKMVRLAAYPGESTEPVDVRLVDLRMQGGSVTAAPQGDAADGPAVRSRRWLTAAAGVGMTVAVGLISLAIRRRKATTSGGPTPIRKPHAVDSRPAAVSFTCPECGAVVKAPAELAGKKGKCPKCSKAVPVPLLASQPGQRSDPPDPA